MKSSLPTSSAEASSEVPTKSCGKSRKCSKASGHSGKCDSKREINRFWEKSPIYNLNKKSHDLHQRFGELTAKENALLQKEAVLSMKEEEINALESETLARLDETECALEKSMEEKELLDIEIEKADAKLKELAEAYNQVQRLLEPSNNARRKRSTTSTSYEMINDYKSSVRYRRREETKKILDFIHGGLEPSFYGAWDYLVSNASNEIMCKLISNYKRGKFIQGIFGKAISDYQNSEEVLKQSVAMKYQNYLSRRTYKLVCKTQTSYFSNEKQVWLPRNMKCLGIDLRLPKLSLSDISVEKFVKSLDIGHVSQIPGIPGVSRTVTGLVFMIIDLHLRVSHLSKKLTWFNENEKHFVFQFSDDGAPETSQLTMSIGSMVCWNFGNEVRSRDFHYLLHCVSVGEKDQIMDNLWKQHTEEMRILEGNVLTVYNKQCTVEFQPGADMSWQSWAANELNQAATYPSPYANVHKGNMKTMGGSIGLDECCTWKPFSMEIRNYNIKELNKFLDSLPESTSEKNRHSRMLEFMAEKGMRQLGPPRIGTYVDNLRPEPIHCEINAWQHYVDLVYLEAVRRNQFNSFVSVLGAPVGGGQEDVPRETKSNSVIIQGNEHNSAGERARQQSFLQTFEDDFRHNLQLSCDLNEKRLPSNQGCGLGYLSSKVKEHYNNEANRYNKLPVRLIGSLAIALARYSYRLVDTLACECETEAQKIQRLALGKIGEYLRNAGGLFNRTELNSVQILELKEACEMYFNLMSLFFPDSVNVSTWTVGYAIPYHANLLFEKYKIGYGIVSLQAKEAKHAGVKKDLVLTNRSNVSTCLGKWWQVMRSNYVRSFYLPEHQPVPSSYISHYQSRLPPHCRELNVCRCGRGKNGEENLCVFCHSSIDIVNCASDKKLKDSVLLALKPEVCQHCNTHFADKFSLSSHLRFCNANRVSSKATNPSAMTVPALKEALRARNLSTTGNKNVLVQRLEGALASEG